MSSRTSSVGLDKLTNTLRSAYAIWSGRAAALRRIGRHRCRATGSRLHKNGHKNHDRISDDLPGNENVALDRLKFWYRPRRSGLLSDYHPYRRDGLRQTGLADSIIVLALELTLGAVAYRGATIRSLAGCRSGCWAVALMQHVAAKSPKPVNSDKDRSARLPRR